MRPEETCVLDSYPVVAAISPSHGVWLVQNRYSGKLFVKKILTRYSLQVFRYLQEHPIPNMPAILELFEEDGTLTVIEEYLHGDTLQTVLDNTGPLGEEETLRILLLLCPTVQALHEAEPSIIHRDIKPGNVLLSPDGIPKLFDVNAARQFTEGQDRDTQVLGTAGYAAPEQYGFQQTDVQTDIYALGVLMNVLVTGQLPSVTPARGKLSPIIRRCTELSPKDRFSSVRELYDALLRVSGKAAPEMRPWQKYLPPGFRSLSPLLMIVSVLLYAIGFSVTATVVSRDASAQTVLLQRIGLSFLLLVLILFNGNYLGVQDVFPGFSGSKKWLRFLLQLGYSLLIFLLGVTVIVLLS